MPGARTDTGMPLIVKCELPLPSYLPAYLPSIPPAFLPGQPPSKRTLTPQRPLAEISTETCADLIQAMQSWPLKTLEATVQS